MVNKFEAAKARLFKNVFVCRKCKSKIRAPPSKVLIKKAKCRKCSGRSLRPIKSKK